MISKFNMNWLWIKKSSISLKHSSQGKNLQKSLPITMVNGSGRHPCPPNRNRDWCWLGVSSVWDLQFQCLASVCFPALKLSKGSWGRQGQSWRWWGPAVTTKIEWIFTTWHYNSWLAAATPLVGPANTADGRHWKTVVPVENYWVLLVLHMCVCEGGSEANFYLFNYFQERKGKEMVPETIDITGM